MKLTLKRRITEKKGDTNKLRREGSIPAIIYGENETGIAVAVQVKQIQEVLRKIVPTQLATTVFDLNVEGKAIQAIIKDVQYQVTTYEIFHIDFLKTSERRETVVKVPIQLIGAADCAGVKLGGFLRQVIRSTKVKCPFQKIPECFSLDVRELGLGESKTLAALTIPSGVKLLAKEHEVVVVVAKKAGS